MGWKTTSVVTTQVMDENPMTWLNAGVKAFHDREYSKGMECVDQAIKLGENNIDVITRANAYKILLYYGLDRESDAHAFFQNLSTKDKLRDYLSQNIEILIGYIKLDELYWKPYFNSIVKEKISKNDVKFFYTYRSYIDDKIFVNNCNDSFLEELLGSDEITEGVEDFYLKTFQTLFYDGYPLNNFNATICDANGEKLQFNLLLVTAMCGLKEATEFLLKNRINDINYQNDQGLTALMMAILYNRVEVTNLLIDNGADVNISNPINGFTAITYAVYLQAYDLVDYLLKKGGIINIRDKEEFSPLALACLGTQQNYNIAKLLIANGANINWTYPLNQNRTILQEIAARRFWDSDNTAIWELLLENDADVDVRDDDGMTALMLSLDHSWWFSDELEFPKALVAHGASMYTRNNHGENAYDIIKRRNIDW